MTPLPRPTGPTPWAAPTLAAPAAPVLSLSIGSLALPGWSVRDGQRLAGAFERELGRLLRATPWPTQTLDTPVLRLPRGPGAPNESPERAGRRLALALVQGLTR